MHIVYPCDEYPPFIAGGIGTAVATLARGMTAAGHKVTTIGWYVEPEPVAQDQGVTIHRLRIPKKHALVNWWLERERLHRAILELHRSDPIDIIEWPDFRGYYWKPIPGIIDVVKVHGTFLSHRLHGLSKRRVIGEYFELRTLRRITNWVGVSRWFNDEWKRIAGVRPRRETIVYNPVNTELFRPLPETENKEPGLVVYAGGLRRRKGVLNLARAAQIFLREVPGSRLVLVGFPADLTEAQVRAEAGPVGEQLEFVPFMQQADLARYLARATVYAMPSLYESCGNTWVEAAACSVPSVGTTLSCGPEIVLDGVTGLISDPNNPADVAEKIIRLLRDPELAHRLGAAGLRRANELFSLDIAVRESESFYEQCIQNRSGA
jgi:glycogen synthase